MTAPVALSAEPIARVPRRRVLSLRATLLIAAALTIGFVAVVGLALVVRVIPAANALTRQSAFAREDVASRATVAAQLDSVLQSVRLHVQRAGGGTNAVDGLLRSRTRIEMIMRTSATLAPLQRSIRTDPVVASQLEKADKAALDVAGTLLGVIGMLEIRDMSGAERLLLHAESLVTPFNKAMSDVTRAALSDLTAREGRVATDARFATVLVGAWLTLGLVLVPLLSLVLRRRLFSPLAALDRSLTRIEHGELHIELPATVDDEIGRLEAHFNRTTDVLRRQRSEAERAAAAAALEESEARYRRAFEEAAVGLAEVALDGTYLRVNRTMTTILARAEPDILGQRDAEFLHPDDRESDAATWPRDGADQVVRADRRYRRGDGRVASVQVTRTLLRDATGSPRHCLSVVQDVTEQRRLESDLLQSRKMDAVGQLAGGVAHDFNNLLTGIIGYADLLEHDGRHSSEVRDHAASIRQIGHRGADLARSLLTLARRTPHRNEPFALEPVLHETVALIRRTFDRRVTVHLSIEGIGTIVGDRSLLANAFLNLALNARDAMPDGGTLTITALRTDPDDVFRRRHDLAHVGQFLCVVVEDTGTGMPPAVVERIFEPFFTTKPVDKGTGLGLATVYGTVKAHRGAILVESEVAHGTRFAMYLPEQVADAATAAVPASAVAARRAAQVLIVDDEPLIRDVVSRMLRRLGYAVELATDGTAALARMASPDHGIDLVLMDGNMPRMSGIETARRLRAIYPDLIMIYGSGNFDPEATDGIADIGFSELLAKPYSLDTLSHAIDRCLSLAGPAFRGTPHLTAGAPAPLPTPRTDHRSP